MADSAARPAAAGAGTPTDAATYHGAKADQGRIVVGRQYPREGYAVIRCGNTEVQIGYTALHNAGRIVVEGQSLAYADQVAFQKALDSITCEASLGRNGDGRAAEGHGGRHHLDAGGPE